jgi:hypothetical protein
MAHIEANNPNLGVDFHDREENVPAVVRPEGSQDSLDLSQLVQSLINGDSFKTVMGQESLDAEYAPHDEVAEDAAQFARASAEAEFKSYLARQDIANAANAAREFSSLNTPDASQTAETTVTLPPGHEYAKTYTKIKVQSSRNLRSTPSANGVLAGTVSTGELDAVEVTSVNDTFRWFYIPAESAFMGIDKTANPGVEMTSTDIAVTATSVATPETPPEGTAIPPQAGTAEPPVLEATSTPELPGPGVAEPPAGPDLEVTPDAFNVESVEGYTLPELARDVITVYPITWPNGTESKIIVKANRDKFREAGLSLYEPKEAEAEQASALVQNLVDAYLEGLDTNEVVMHGYDRTDGFGREKLNEKAKSIHVPQEFETTFKLDEKPFTIVWVSDWRDVPNLYYNAVYTLTVDSPIPSLAYLIEPSNTAAHNVIYVYVGEMIPSNPSAQPEARYVTNVLSVPLMVLRYNFMNSGNPNFSFSDDLRAGSTPWQQIPQLFPEVAQSVIPQLVGTIEPEA